MIAIGQKQKPKGECYGVSLSRIGDVSAQSPPFKSLNRVVRDVVEKE